MEWIMTIGLMWVILMGGVIAAINHGALHPNATEPHTSYQMRDFGVAFVIASIVPFWRGHPIVGGMTLIFGIFMLLVSGISLWHYKELGQPSR